MSINGSDDGYTREMEWDRLIQPHGNCTLTDWGAHINFLRCIKSRKATYHGAEDMHRTSTMAQMGNLSMKLNRKLQWDPSSEEFIKDREAKTEQVSRNLYLIRASHSPDI